MSEPGDTEYDVQSILFTRGKHFHDRIISPRVEVRAHEISLVPQLLIEVPVPSQENERSCICVEGNRVYLLFFYWILKLFSQCGVYIYLFITFFTIYFFFW